MSVIHRSARVQYSPAKMFQLVDDVEKYPEFLPWCKEALVHLRTPQEVKATLNLSLAGLSRQFTTCNHLQHPKMIEIRLLDGPFHHLEGFWQFAPLPEGQTRISFDLEFEWKNKWANFTFEPLFHQMANSLVTHFVQRAAQLYG